MTTLEFHNKPRTRVVIACSEGVESDRRAEVLAEQLALPYVAEGDICAGADFVLAYKEGKLTLRDCQHPRMKPFAIDLHVRAGEQSRRQPLARAIGKTPVRVIDATAGLGQDALRMAVWGCEVLALERSSVIAALLNDAVRRAMENTKLAQTLGGRLLVKHADARAVLMQPETVADVIYLDPMFPEKRRRSALARKEMRIVRALVGEDEDAIELLAVARRCARRRVVVKRPTYAQPLVETPDFSQEGKLVRYDVYLTSGGVGGDGVSKNG